jgi:hypothetical protein
MSLIRDLLERPGDLSITSKYTVLNGVIYLGIGALVVIWPGMVQTIFWDAAFVGNEAALIRVVGMTVMVMAGSIYSVASPAADGSSPRAYWTEWRSFRWRSFPWPSQEFFLIFCSRLRFSTRCSELALGCFSVSPFGLAYWGRSNIKISGRIRRR